MKKHLLLALCLCMSAFYVFAEKKFWDFQALAPTENVIQIFTGWNDYKVVGQSEWKYASGSVAEIGEEIAFARIYSSAKNYGFCLRNNGSSSKKGLYNHATPYAITFIALSAGDILTLKTSVNAIVSTFKGNHGGEWETLSDGTDGTYEYLITSSGDINLMVSAGAYIYNATISTPNTKLNGVSYKRTAYNMLSRKSTILLETDQTDVYQNPEVTINYAMTNGQSGTAQSGEVIIVPNGTLTLWTTAEGYESSDVTTVEVKTPGDFHSVWNIDFTAFSKSDALTLGETMYTTRWGGANKDFKTITIGANDIHSDFCICEYSANFFIHNGGLLNGASGERWVAIRNAEKGDHIIVTLGTNSNEHQISINKFAGNGNVKSNPMETFESTYAFIVTESGNIVFSIGRSNIIYTLGVYTAHAPIKCTPAEVSDGYMTFYNSKIDYIAPSNVSVYTLSKSNQENYLALKEVTNKIIPAGNAVLLKGSPNELFELTCSDNSNTTLEGNILRGTDTDLEQEADEFIYVLSVDNNKENVGFYKYTGKTLTAGKAYIDPADLTWGGQNAPMVRIATNTTGIESITTSETTSEAAIYDLFGRRVAEPTKGLYIKEGKKVLVK